MRLYGVIFGSNEPILKVILLIENNYLHIFIINI